MRRKSIFKLALLSISLVLTSGGTIAGSIPLMAKEFVGVPQASVELLTTIPAFMVMIFVLLSSIIAKFLTPKYTVLLGLTIAFFSGLVPVFSNDFTVILISRAGLGIGFGLFNAFAVSLISDFFEGTERAQLIGFQAAFQSLGAAAMTFVAGQLLKINWHQAYWVYAIILPIAVVFFLVIPKTQTKDNGNEVRPKVVLKTNVAVVSLVVFLFITIMLDMATQIKLAQLFLENHYGNETDASSALSLAQLVGLITALMFGTIYKILKKWMLPVAVLAMAVGFFGLNIADNLFLAMASVLFVTAAFAMYVPYLFTQVAHLSPEGSNAFSTSLLLVGANLGASMSPYGLAIIGDVVGASTTNALFGAGSIILLVLAIVVIVVTIHSAKNSNRMEVK
ncbi:MFS transporter [Leuconostoc sp. MS02]|uniref:MFS transporter n=1 Tax=Leuconostoc aquikimchii TaxID=3236804 RepID=A0ABV3S0N9_9LACO